MRKPQDPDELELVRRAICLSHVRGCCEWDDKTAERLEDQPPCPDLTLEDIRQLLSEFVKQKGEILQVREKRPEYSHRRFYYKAIVPVEGFHRPLFIELVLANEDQDFPMVRIVNAHE